MNWKVRFNSLNNEYRGTMIIQAETFQEAMDKFDRISLGALSVQSVNMTDDKDKG